MEYGLLCPHIFSIIRFLENKFTFPINCNMVNSRWRRETYILDDNINIPNVYHVADFRTDTIVTPVIEYEVSTANVESDPMES